MCVRYDGIYRKCYEYRSRSLKKMQRHVTTLARRYRFEIWWCNSVSVWARTFKGWQCLMTIRGSLSSSALSKKDWASIKKLKLEHHENGVQSSPSLYPIQALEALTQQLRRRRASNACDSQRADPSLIACSPQRLKQDTRFLCLYHITPDIAFSILIPLNRRKGTRPDNPS